jgi:hypothetical protein
MGRIAEGRRSNKVHLRIFFPLALLTLLLGCTGTSNRNPTVWRMDVRSPDGAWIATARTDQWGGFGSAWVETTVSIRRTNGTVNRGTPFDIFSYPLNVGLPRPYVLSDDNADRNLQLRWTSPKHLEIKNHSQIVPSLIVVRFSDVDISYDINQIT